MRVSLFATCLGDQFFADACADTVRLLRHFGATVDFPESQTCCGQPAFNAGYRPEAHRMMLHTLEALEGDGFVVLPSGSCAGMIRSLYPDLAATDQERARVEALRVRTFELSEFLVKVVGVTDMGTGLSGMRIAYHHGCHALRELGVESEPVALLEAAGATVEPWEAHQECCGFGGLFSTKLPEVSVGMADRKLETLPAVDLVTSADAGCLMQLSGRARHLGQQTRFMHLARVLWSGVSGAPLGDRP